MGHQQPMAGLNYSMNSTGSTQDTGILSRSLQFILLPWCFLPALALRPLLPLGTCVWGTSWPCPVAVVLQRDPLLHRSSRHFFLLQSPQ